MFIMQSLVVMPGCKLEVWDKGDGQEQVLFSRKKDLILGWMEQALTKITLMIALSFHIPCSRLQRRRKSLQMLATSGIIRTGAHQSALNKLLNIGENTLTTGTTGTSWCSQPQENHTGWRSSTTISMIWTRT